MRVFVSFLMLLCVICFSEDENQIFDPLVPLDNLNDSKMNKVPEKDSQVEILRILLEHGADPNAINNFGATPIHFRAVEGSTQAVELLLSYKANPNLRCKNGSTPLSLAIEFGHLETIKALLVGKADPNIPGHNGKSCIQLANETYGSSDDLMPIIDLLCKYGAKVPPDFTAVYDNSKESIDQNISIEDKQRANRIKILFEIGYPLRPGEKEVLKKTLESIRYNPK